LTAAKKRVDERAAGNAGAGMHGHASGLVDDDYVGVLVEDIERDIFGRGLERWARLGVYRDALAAFQLECILGGMAVDENEAARMSSWMRVRLSSGNSEAR